jgi:4,5-DOPA dioxygenase extradiol
MDRKLFFKSISLLPFVGKPVSATFLKNFATSLKPSELMPAIFIGHGSPMNAIEDNEFVREFVHLGKTLPTPQAILCISAHWETKGTMITAMEHPRTIHDFGGFPEELYQQQYPAPGSLLYAQEIQNAISTTKIELDHNWGLDHGAWSVLKHIFPLANIPVLQMSLDYTRDPSYHYALGLELSRLRRKGVLILGSGNIVHNLGLIAFDKMNVPDFGFDWAKEVKDKVNKNILTHHHQPLIDYAKQGKAFQLAIPSPEHYLPLLYILAMQEKDEKPSLFNDKSQAGSLSMTSVRLEKM